MIRWLDVRLSWDGIGKTESVVVDELLHSNSDLVNSGHVSRPVEDILGLLRMEREAEDIRK